MEHEFSYLSSELPNYTFFTSSYLCIFTCIRGSYSLCFFIRMPENKSVIGLVWAPKVPPLFGVKNSSEKLHNQTKDPVLTPGTELVDGLYVPPRDPRKMNKLLKKNMKDTAGRSW